MTSWKNSKPYRSVLGIDLKSIAFSAFTALQPSRLSNGLFSINFETPTRHITIVIHPSTTQKKLTFFLAKKNYLWWIPSAVTLLPPNNNNYAMTEQHFTFISA